MPEINSKFIMSIERKDNSSNADCSTAGTASRLIVDKFITGIAGLTQATLHINRPQDDLIVLRRAVCVNCPQATCHQPSAGAHAPPPSVTTRAISTTETHPLVSVLVSAPAIHAQPTASSSTPPTLNPPTAQTSPPPPAATLPIRPTSRCLVCQCFILAKTAIANEKCPLGKW